MWIAPVDLEVIPGHHIVDVCLTLNTISQKTRGELAMCISLSTASFMSLMYSSALFTQGVPSSRAHNVVPIMLQNCLRSGDIYSPAISLTITSGAPISLENCFTASKTTDFLFIGTT